MRTFATALAGILAGCLAFLAMSLTLGWWTAGTASNLSASVVSVLDTSGGATALATAVVDQAVNAAPEADRAALAERAPMLTQAAGQALAQAREPLAKAIGATFTAIADGVRVAVDLGPVLRPVLAAMNRVDPSIPATMDGPTSLDVDGSALGVIATVITVLGLWWVAVLVAVAVLVGTAFASGTTGWRRLRPSGIALAVPALLVILLALLSWLATSSLATSASGGEVAVLLAESVIGVVRTKALVVGLIAGLVAAALIGTSFMPLGRATDRAVARPGPPASA